MLISTAIFIAGGAAIGFFAGYVAARRAVYKLSLKHKEKYGLSSHLLNEVTDTGGWDDKTVKMWVKDTVSSLGYVDENSMLRLELEKVDHYGTLTGIFEGKLESFSKVQIKQSVMSAKLILLVPKMTSEIEELTEAERNTLEELRKLDLGLEKKKSLRSQRISDLPL